MTKPIKDAPSTEPKPTRDAKGRWLKGTPAPHPQGRPTREHSLTEILRQKALSPGEGGRVLAVVLAEKLIKFALDGDVNAMKYVYDRLEGRPAQALDISGDLRFLTVEQMRELAKRASQAPED